MSLSTDNPSIIPVSIPINFNEKNGDDDDNNKPQIFDHLNNPFNYIIVIDAGSKGTRAFIYAYSENIGLFTKSNWSKKIKYPIESSNNLNNYLNNLIKKIYNLIPIEQHYRTPIFFHATAGLRSLNPYLQSKFINNICGYLINYTDFYLPDCTSHVNILDGDIEGLYSWISLNYLLNNNNNNDNQLIDNFQKSYGILQLGGGSAQICFQPKSNIKNDQNQLLTLNLNRGDKSNFQYELFSTSFLGYGLNQFHADYLNSLNNNDTLIDPCLPLNYNYTLDNINNYNIIDDDLVKGSSNFNECLSKIYNIFAENNESCKNLLVNNDGTDENENDTDFFKVSNCMIQDIPDFNLQLDDFIGVTGYSDIYHKLLNQTNTQTLNDYYNPELFLNLTKSVCSKSYDSLLLMNENFDPDLCFKSTYLLSLLHSGYGLPIDNIDNTNSLKIQNRFNGNFKFTWTLGRALLYAYDELDSNNQIGYFKNIQPSVFYNGAEQDGINSRPKFELKDNYEKLSFKDLLDENDNDDLSSDNKSVSRKNPHFNWLIILIILIILISWLILKKKLFIKKLFHSISNSKYSRLNNQMHIGPEPIIMNDLDFDIENDNNNGGKDRDSNSNRNRNDEFNMNNYTDNESNSHNDYWDVDDEDYEDNDSDGIERAV